MTRLLLLCGIVAPLVYLATVIAGAAAVPQYSHIAMAVSALAQRGTPHPMVIEIGFSLSAVLSAAFGFGIWKTAGDRDGALHLSGALLIAYGIVALMITTAFPMDPVGGEVTLPGIMHLVLVGLSAMILLAAILLAGFAFGRNAPWFRAYSVVSGLLLLRAQYPEVPVMIISAVEDHKVIRRTFDLGAAGYLPKSVGPADIRKAIDTVLSGEISVPDGVSLDGDDEQSAFIRRLATLTPQPIRTLQMLSDGLMNKQIAYELSISEATVKAHVSSILQKLDVDSRTQAVIAASRIEQGQFEALLEG